MTADSLHFDDLARTVETTGRLTADLALKAADAIDAYLSAQAEKPAPAGAAPVSAEDFGSTHRILHLVDRVTPGWTIQLRGKAFEPDGHWTCSLRPSEARDEAEVIGHAQGPDLSTTLVVALLRVLAYQTRKDRGR